jgi:hypothetical protein
VIENLKAKQNYLADLDRRIQNVANGNYTARIKNLEARIEKISSEIARIKKDIEFIVDNAESITREQKQTKVEIAVLRILTSEFSFVNRTANRESSKQRGKRKKNKVCSREGSRVRGFLADKHVSIVWLSKVLSACAAGEEEKLISLAHEFVNQSGR